jgi:hypothetical protein
MSCPYQVLLASTLVATFFSSGCALGKVVDYGPQHLDEMSSIGKVLANAGKRSVHILYVHGMDATGSGDSLVFQKGICEILKDCTLPSSATRDYADSGIFAANSAPPPIQYMSQPVWNNAEEWSASAPFVDHYVITRSNGGPIVIDEINWWPLVFPIKCRNMITGEAQLAGPDASLLGLCATATQRDQKNPGRFTSFQWLTPDQTATFKAMPRRAALVNRLLKNSILDWGVSDAFLVVGSMQTIFREAMRQLFVKTARFHATGEKNSEWLQQFQNPQALDREFVVVSHSLGSYLVFSTLNNNEPTDVPQNANAESSADTATQDAAAKYILERTSLVYFFANQVALLELADASEPSPGETPARQAAQAQTARTQAPSAQAAPKGPLTQRIRRWIELRQRFKQKISAAGAPAPQEPEIFAWSDPSDVLTWYVPPMAGVKVDNLYVRNTWWHWLVADPETAHGNYAKNKGVLKAMMKP